MYLKARNKYLRKYDCDFWNFVYNRRRKNKFFTYFKLSLINKLQFFRKKNFLFFNKNKKLKFKKIKNYNIFSNSFLRNINFHKYFNKRRKTYVRYVFNKFTSYKPKSAQNLFGTKTAFERYVNKVKSQFLRFKNFIKIFTLFYNNFNQRKLRKLAEINKKSRIGVLISFY